MKSEEDLKKEVIESIIEAVENYRSDGKPWGVAMTADLDVYVCQNGGDIRDFDYADFESLSSFFDIWIDDEETSPQVLAEGFVDVCHQQIMEAFNEWLEEKQEDEAINDITNKFFFFYREEEEALTEAVTGIISVVKEDIAILRFRNANVFKNREYLRAEITRFTWIAAREENANLSKNQKNYLAKLIFESYIH